MNAEKILAIPDSEPERLFRDRAVLAGFYRELVKQWHPDASSDPRATEVFSKLSTLYAAAQRKATDGTWEDVGSRILRPRDGKPLRLRYRKRKKFELGEVLISKNLVTYVIPRDHEDMVIRGLRAVGSIRYPNEKFKDALEPYMPKTAKVMELEGGGYSVSLVKDPDDVAVDDLMAHMGGRVPPEHVAWITSSMLNLLAYLQTQGTTLNGITPGTVFANPRRHSVSFLGGWWYAASAGHQVLALPPETYRLASPQLRATKRAEYQLDLSCARWVARSALGDPSGGSLRTRGDVRREVAEFLLAPSGRSAVDEYHQWYEILGKRKFVALRVSGDDAYPELT